MKHEKDHDLLVIASMKEELDESHAAFHEFYCRYKEFLWSAISHICRNHHNGYELSTVIYSNTWINVYDYASSFSVDEKLGDKHVRKKIEGWLISIARTEFKSILMKKDKPKDPFVVMQILDDKQELEMISAGGELPEDDDEIPLSVQIVTQALQVLSSERERHILLAYYQYYEPGKSYQAKNLDPRVRKELAERYNTTEDNIRTIISRSKRKIIDYLKGFYNSNDHE